MIHRAPWAVVALTAGVLLQSIYHHQLGWGITLGVTALAAGAAVRPYEALLVYVGLLPLSSIILVLSRVVGAFHLAEGITLACLTGWGIDRAWRPRPLAVGPWLRWMAIAFIGLAVAAACAAAASVYLEEPQRAIGFVPQFLWHDYLLDMDRIAGPMLVAEGVLVMLLVADACAGDRARREGVMRMMVAGIAAAACFNLLRVVLVALSREAVWPALVYVLKNVRVSVHFGDLNAAGSWFALVLPLAAALIPRVPLLAVPCTLILTAALWVSGSRVALAATVVAGALTAVGMALRVGRRGRVIAVAALVTLVLLTAAGIRWYPAERNVQMPTAIAYRTRMTRAALAMSADAPLFGVGVGRYFELSTKYAGPGVQENAHNYYLQILAELGVPALLLFLTVIGLAMKTGFASARTSLPDLGLMIGLLTFLLTAIAGHPLLTALVAFGFWTALGLAAAPLTVSPASSWRARAVGIAALALFAVTLPARTTAAVRVADVEGSQAGLSRWQRRPDGSRYRWAGGRSTFFVESNGRAVRLRLKSGPLAPDTMDVRIFLDGRQVDAVRLEKTDDTRTVRVIVRRRVEAAFSRIDLEAVATGDPRVLDRQPTDAAGVLVVDRPEIER